MTINKETVYRVYHVVAGKGHQPVTRAGQPLNFRTVDTAKREAAKRGPKAHIVPFRPGELRAVEVSVSGGEDRLEQLRRQR